MHEWVHCCDEAAIQQLPTAVVFWIIQIVSLEECSSLMQNLMQIHYSTFSVILNVMVTQYTCSLNGVYCPHWIVQWSCHCSHIHIPVHSPWLPGYVDVMPIVLVISTIARHTLCVCVCVCVCDVSSWYTYIYLFVFIYKICPEKFQALLMRTVCVTSMKPGSQGEWTGMHMCEQWRHHCTSQWGEVEAFEWACVLCGCNIQNDWVSRATSLHQILH